ncbi:MAG: STAS-like domain-containing protein [Castellaniella sp.]|nr:STAS-like domain-containing protein [Castellaniella sp.]
MTSTFKITVPERFKLATRPNGIVAREEVLRVLEKYDLVELDFAGADPTPSFVDECLGILCKTIGLKAFRDRVKISNLTDSSRSLFKVVISRRLAEGTA